MSKQFSDIEEFSKWILENNYSISNFKFNTKNSLDCNDCTITTTSSESDEFQVVYLDEENTEGTVNIPSVFDVRDINVKIKSLSDESISIKVMPINEDINYALQNKWFVDDYECIKDVCSTSKITFKGDTLLMNVCESEGNATVFLIVEIENEIKHLPFTLKRSCQKDSDHDIIISI